MKFLKTITLGALLLSSTISAQEFGFNIGPFSLLFNAGHRAYLDAPICYAISNQKRLEIIVENKEKTSEKEIKITVKMLIIEPYAFGVTGEEKPVLQGNVVEEKLVKEVSVKYGEERFKDAYQELGEKEGIFSGWFKTSKNQTIDVRKITNLDVIEDSHFDIPKNYKGPKREEMHVICQLPIDSDE